MDKLQAMKNVGNEWKGGDHHRLYFNIPYEELGLEVWYYKSGNVSSAKLDGERISNSEARRVMGRIGKVFYDMVSGEIVTQYWRDEELEARALRLVDSMIESEMSKEMA